MFNSVIHLGRVAALAVLLAVALGLAGGGVAAAASQSGHGPFAVGMIFVRFIDTRREVTLPGQPPEPRQLLTVIRYPAVGGQSTADRLGAPPATASGPFPLVVFGHGLNATPSLYASLLHAWASAGYVVAAPVFPLSNANAPGGADEDDIVNQPADMSFVITQILADARAGHGTLSGLVDPQEIAVAGQSDGAATALASAYDGRYLDPRVDAAIILSGAEIMPGEYFGGRNPPLLATEGTADKENLPKYAYQFFHAAHGPKFFLKLLGAGHLGPYTDEQPQLGVVEQVTVAFLNRYLKGLPGSRRQLWRAGDAPGVATLSNGV